MSDIEGASFGVALKLSDEQDPLHLVPSNEDDTSLTYTDKGWFNGRAARKPPRRIVSTTL